ncbi:MAG TPA: OmpA family protein [Polyangiaceae bacterium LLY-WYZ-15_(1-7)]|mgnify:CR=1 FL=1|nr:hypothetical protein [Myxococcales bacterium]MAT25161.1 hypothetical protein [Sandaracinus sp.]HJK90083.1 OmpA family protein [Polyangiaceae bacterium LLY-WYZ-15_(1-7)]MBJ72370.1 hypothetical protein [Sandaracinus sp.]HJL02832.1 OmpA family protein [Polyangiaceae bacterium LLY-WYZ-15_(1-7)]
MRARLLRFGFGWTFGLGCALTVALALSPTPFAASPAAAQFDDEFDDEFDAEPEEETPPPAEDSGGSDDGFDDDGFGEGFDDDFDEPAEEDDTSSLEDDLADAEADGAPADDEAPPADDEDEPADDDLQERLLATSYNSYYGPTGGLHVIDAGGGAVGTFRVQLATEFFFSSGFINEGDDADHIGGSLSLDWTVHEMVEIWASIQSYANSNDTGDPTLFQVLGDTHLGAKVFGRVLPFLTVGGDIDLMLLNTVGDIGLVFKGTSIGLRANATLDLRGLDNPIPFIGRFNVQYVFDNSSNLTDDVEQERYANLEDPAPDIGDESRHLLTPVERFALNINRTDFLNIGLGFEAPIEVAEDFYLQPLLEWVWNIPVNRQGYNCLFIPAEPGGDEPVAGEDGCLDRQGVGSFPMNLTLGARIKPPVDGLSFLLAADVGLTGKKRSQFVREIAPNAPYNLYLGLSYAYDPSPPAPPEPEVRIVERRVEVEGEGPPMGRIAGQVLEQGAGTPVAGAVIRFPGRDLTALVAGDDGRFTTYRMEPGEVQMALSHPDYNDGTCVATIPEPSEDEGEGDDAASDEEGEGEGDEDLIEVQVRCELVALPRVGSIRGTVVSGDDGSNVAGASITVTGPGNGNATSVVDGSFNIQELAPGSYQVRVDADGFLIKMETLEVQARAEATPTITLVPRPQRALVRVRTRDIQIRRKVNFATNSAEILPSSEPLLTEVADVLLRNEDIRRVEIQGHTDNRGPAARNRTLSQQRADAVRTWLIEHGVDAGRLEARGYGPDNPLVPNITPANRARNRRVQFVIQERAETE